MNRSNHQTRRSKIEYHAVLEIQRNLIISYIILQQILNGGNNNQIGSLRFCHYKKIIQRISYLVKIYKISPIATLSEMKSDIETVKKI